MRCRWNQKRKTRNTNERRSYQKNLNRIRDTGYGHTPMIRNLFFYAGVSLVMHRRSSDRPQFHKRNQGLPYVHNLCSPKMLPRLPKHWLDAQLHLAAMTSWRERVLVCSVRPSDWRVRSSQSLFDIPQEEHARLRKSFHWWGEECWSWSRSQFRTFELLSRELLKVCRVSYKNYTSESTRIVCRLLSLKIVNQAGVSDSWRSNCLSINVLLLVMENGDGNRWEIRANAVQ